MDIRKLQRAIVDGLEDVKAHDIVVFNTEALSPLFERVIIASGTSNRQTKALAASVRDAVKAVGAPVPRLEGAENGEWIIVDCGAAVAHIMQPAIRDYYRLEEIWGIKPVAMKSAVRKSGLPKAEEPAPAKAAARRSASPAAGKAAGKTSARSTGQAAPRPATKASKAPARPAAGAPVRATAKTGAKSSAKSGTARSAKPATGARRAAGTQAQPKVASSSAARSAAKPAPRTSASSRTTKAPAKKSAGRTPPARGR
jgi:ribosome-associated protein